MSQNRFQGATCPFCKTKITQLGKFGPFCSKRCQLLDLGAWAEERYRIPLEADKTEQSATAEEQEDHN